jgi:hypothetical protein
MMEITTREVEFTADGTLLEVLRIVDVKDSIARSGCACASG